MATSMEESSFENGEKHISVTLKCLAILTQASATKESLCKDQSQHLIENVLHQNLLSLESWMNNGNEPLFDKEFVPLKEMLTRNKEGLPYINIRHFFSFSCIYLLSHLTSLLNIEKFRKETNNELKLNGKEGSQSENACPTLSVQQEKQISSCLQFVVVLGLCPYLPRGVGIPVSERLGPGQILLATAEDTVTDVSEVDRLRHLIPVLKLLVKMLNCPHLRVLVTEKFLSDIFVVLIQVRHSAKIVLQSLNSVHNDRNLAGLKSKETTNVTRMKEELLEDILQDEDGVYNIQWMEGGKELTVDVIDKVVHECNVELDRSIRHTSVPSVLREVLCLLGFVKSSPDTKSVPWFRRIVAGILRDVIMNPPGVQHLLQSFLGDSSHYDTKDWQNCRAVARIISHCPVSVKNVEQFYTSVSQQLLDLIHPREQSVPLTITKAVGAAILELDSLQGQLMTRVCFSHLLDPLNRCSAAKVSTTSKRPASVVVSERELSDCMSHCHRLFVVSQETQSPLCVQLQPAMGVLFYIYVQTRHTAAFIKGMVRDLLSCYLNYSDTKNAVACVLDLLLQSSPTTKPTFSPVHPNVSFVSGAGGGVEAVIDTDKRENIKSWTHPASAVVDILKSTKCDDLNSELFIALLQRLTSIVVTETSPLGDVLLPARALPEDVKAARLKELREKVLMVSLISEAGEEFGSSIFHSTSQILAFTKVTLDRCVAMCSSSDTDTRMFEWETLTMSLGLLSTVLGIGCGFTDEDKTTLDSIVPLLSSLSQSEVVEPPIRDMAADLRVSVATRGLVTVNMGAKTNETSKLDNKKGMASGKTEKPSSSKPLIEVLSSGEGSSSSDPIESARYKNMTPSSTVESNKGPTIDNNKWDNDDVWCVSMREVDDSQIPVKGHGLISLARMVEDRHPGATTHSARLLKIFLENLNNSDSYIYLASVNGLSALGDLCHKEVIPSLTAEFMSKCKDSQCSWETIVKVGEAIVKATRRLGEMAPSYRDILLSAILFGCHHDNCVVRASCLSGLADVCKLLRYSISPVIQEVLMCCRSVLRSDPDPDPRRAAALTLASLLQGLGKEVITVLGEDMTELYRVLKQAALSDLDDKVKGHAHIALEQLDVIMKDFLFPSQDLKKSISILGYQ